MFVFFFKQKTAYEMRISDWSSDVCSSDLFETVDLRHPDVEQDAARLELTEAFQKISPATEGAGAELGGAKYEADRPADVAIIVHYMNMLRRQGNFLRDRRYRPDIPK